MRFKTLTYLITVLTLLLMNACTNTSNKITYGSDYKPSIDFSTYKTYSWHEPNEFNRSSEEYIANEIVDERIRKKVDEQLAAKGMQKVESGKVDFYVNYSILTKDKIDIRTYNTYNGYASGWRFGVHHGGGYQYHGLGYHSYEPEVETNVTQYTQGTFVLDIVNSDAGKLVWRGTAQGRLAKSKRTPEEREAKITEVVKETLSGFPPKPK